MSKLAWYVVIMIAIDVVLYIARFGVAIIKSTKKDDGPSEESAPQDKDTTTDSDGVSANPPSA